MATEYGSLPFPEAIEYLRRKIDLPTEHWDDILGAAHDRYFMVAGAAKADLLADLHEAVRKGIEDGTTLEEFRRDFDKLVYKNGWTGFTGEDTPGGLAWRTNVIYSTNLRTAYQAGRFAQHREGAADRPYLQYNHSDGVEHPRPLHQRWDGTILAASDPWWNTHYTPNGWGCRCYITSLAPRDLKRLGKDGPDPTPDDGTYIHRDRNGVAHELPAGVDYGWAHAPGQTRDLVRELEAKAAKLPRQIGDDLKADLAKSSPEKGRSAEILRQQSFESARQDCVAFGKANDRERLILVDDKTGRELTRSDGGPRSVSFTEDVLGIINDEESGARIIHNHPGDSPFSSADLFTLVRPGVTAIEAIGQGGSRYTAEAVVKGGELFGKAFGKADDAVHNYIRPGAGGLRIPLGIANWVHYHIVASALDAAGIIRYQAILSAEKLAAIADYMPLIDKAVALATRAAEAAK
jgi:hypothetical protein